MSDPAVDLLVGVLGVVLAVVQVALAAFWYRRGARLFVVICAVCAVAAGASSVVWLFAAWSAEAPFWRGRPALEKTSCPPGSDVPRVVRQPDGRLEVHVDCIPPHGHVQVPLFALMDEEGPK